MQQIIEHGAAEPTVLKTSKITMQELVSGAIVDKRSIAISPERLGRAVANYNPVLGDDIITNGRFTILTGAVPLRDLVEGEAAMAVGLNGEPAFGGNRMSVGYGCNPHMSSPQYNFAIFGNDVNDGVFIQVHQCLFQHAQGYGPGGLINVIISHMLKEEANIGLGFGN